MTTGSILFQSSGNGFILRFITLAAITQAITLTSVFIPGTLTVTESPPINTTLEIPTIDFNSVDPMASSVVAVETDTPPTLGFSGPSLRWSQLIARAAFSSAAPTWDPPAGCGLSCTYSFTYSAPAFNCTELSRKDIWPSGTNTSDSLLAFPLNSTDPNFPINEYFFYNASYAFLSPNISAQDLSFSTLDVIYMEGFNTTWNETLSLSNFPDPSQYNPRGVHCEYQNATYEATTTFTNNTQSSSTRVTQLHGYLPIGHDADGPYYGTNTTNMTLAFRSIAQVFSEIFNGNAFYMTNMSSFVMDSTDGLHTPLFSLTGNFYQGDSFMSSEYFFDLSPSLGGNLSFGIQSLLGNVTLAFVSEGTASTFVPASVFPDTTQYQYHAIKLVLIYGVVFGVSLFAVAYGLICLQSNGTTAIFDFEHIVEMTAESRELHASALSEEYWDYCFPPSTYSAGKMRIAARQPPNTSHPSATFFLSSCLLWSLCKNPTVIDNLVIMHRTPQDPSG
ncbi:hypothetical protein BDP27DRAFT_1408512 [Rhodocollybia butyracea]|uniref:Uncharacterized protein n=1 Tax=Rhodocollybia butyracea TaxID=206335 RepID=A0A9P5P7N2_9AGAR|nr:hypothetical protein BDP27DRAFT_1408512 [Rhodocollybia butyracea]